MENVESKVFGKDSIVRALKDELGGTIKDATKAYESFLKVTKDAADNGKEVRLAGLGTLKRVVLEAGEARNPSSGATVQVPAREKYALKSKPVAI